MFDNIKSDLLRNCCIVYGTPSLMNRCRITLQSMGFHAITVYRFGSWSNAISAGGMMHAVRYFFLALHYLLSRLIAKMYGIAIDRRAVIGKGLYIGHFAGINIGPCKMGDCCSVHQHVKIGSTDLITSQNTPHIGSYVWIGPHSEITGKVTIGNNSTVSAGTIVINDVSANNLVVGDPARIISTLYDNRSLLNSI